MSVIVQDDFESYTVGTHPPLGGATGTAGWDSDTSFAGCFGTVVATDPYSPTGKSFQLGQLRSTNPSAQAAVYITFDLFTHLGGNYTANGGIVRCLNFDVPSNAGPEVLLVGIAEDGRIFASSFNQHIGISQTAVHFNTWYKVRLDILWDLYDLGDGVFRISTQVKLYIEDSLEFDHIIATGVPVSVLPLGIGANRFFFIAASNQGSTIDNIRVATSGETIVPSSLPGRVASEVNEVVLNDTTYPVSIASEVIELPSRPPVCLALIASEVIELVVRDLFPPAGWKVYEA